MDMHDMQAAPPPMTATPTGHSSHGMSLGSMAMGPWFQATTTATLWFREWMVDDRGKCVCDTQGCALSLNAERGCQKQNQILRRYAGSVIGLFALGFGVEVLQRLRFELLIVQRRYQGQEWLPSTGRSVEKQERCASPTTSR